MTGQSKPEKFCSQCGKKFSRMKLWMWLPLVVLVAFLIIAKLESTPEIGKPTEESIAFASLVKSQVKDPQSFFVVELRRSQIGATCITYRSKTSFNSYTQSHSVKAPDGRVQIDVNPRTEPDLWDAYCSDGKGETIAVVGLRL